MRDVVFLERVEQRCFDLRLLGNGRERHLLLFSLEAQSSAKTVWHEAREYQDALHTSTKLIQIGVARRLQPSAAELIRIVASTPAARYDGPCCRTSWRSITRFALGSSATG
jgi:hypothetical protein